MRLTHTPNYSNKKKVYFFLSREQTIRFQFQNIAFHGMVIIFDVVQLNI